MSVPLACFLVAGSAGASPSPKPPTAPQIIRTAAATPTPHVLSPVPGVRGLQYGARVRAYDFNRENATANARRSRVRRNDARVRRDERREKIERRAAAGVDRAHGRDGVDRAGHLRLRSAENESGSLFPGAPRSPASVTSRDRGRSRTSSRNARALPSRSAHRPARSRTGRIRPARAQPKRPDRVSLRCRRAVSRRAQSETIP